MAEELLMENPHYPGLDIREDIEIYKNEELNCIIIKDKDTSNVLVELPLKNGPE